ncbi:hypothetical protein CI105_08015 [Candidatus Izimaplasma bacterium ZiA1]|uniref:primosomal protein DnaI n=1 Tax=Candidatus Izimoplasma sp. ZiA1 TaxID=2024899 RepID=UPI000BAA4D77|nr:hypothetical protein CI105_08015 [Candidatus Izimaplasma bacterium ZiA1]
MDFKEELIEELLKNQDINDFMIHNDLNSHQLDDHLNDLLVFNNEINICNECVGIDSCKLNLKGLTPVLVYELGAIKLAYSECRYKVRENNYKSNRRLLDSMYMPKRIELADIEDYYTTTEERMNVYNYMMRFIKLYPTGEKMKGLYLEGPYQKGKTYTLAALANEMIKLGYTVIIAYFPDLVRELKSAIGNGKLEQIVKKLKNVDILMLDDIGGEAQSPWVRDEVLGPILQHRLLDEMPTFFSSNVSQKELGKYLTKSSEQAEKMKAFRIVSRIVSLSDEYKL